MLAGRLASSRGGRKQGGKEGGERMVRYKREGEGQEEGEGLPESEQGPDWSRGRKLSDWLSRERRGRVIFLQQHRWSERVCVCAGGGGSTHFM